MRDTTSARVNRIALRLMVTTCSSLSWPADRLLRGYAVAISLSLAIAVLGFVGQALGLPDRFLSPLMYAALIGCVHPVLIAAALAETIVGRPDYMAGQTDIAWNAVFCCALALYVLALLGHRSIAARGPQTSRPGPPVCRCVLRDDRLLGLLHVGILIAASANPCFAAVR